MNLTKQMAGLLGVAAGFSAMATPPTPANGVMQFPNVVVEVAPTVASNLAPDLTPDRARTLAEQARAAPRQHGMTAYKDPATGQLTAPTPEQAAALMARARRSAPAGEPATVKSSPHGGVSLRLDARHERFATAGKNAHGAVGDSCALHGQLEHALERPFAPTPGEHDEK